MKYTTEIIVDLPLDIFVVKLDNPENMKHWQKGFVGYKPLSARQGEEGVSVANLLTLQIHCIE